MEELKFLDKFSAHSPSPGVYTFWLSEGAYSPL